MITLRDVFNYAYERIKLRYPDIKPLRFIAFDDENPEAYAFEDDKSITVAIGCCVQSLRRMTYSHELAIYCVGLLAHEVIGHDLTYGIISPPASIVRSYSSDDDENIPYHVQFAIAGHKECIQKIKECDNLCLMSMVNMFVKVRDEVTRYLNERNPKKQWRRYVA